MLSMWQVREKKNRARADAAREQMVLQREQEDMAAAEHADAKRRDERKRSSQRCGARSEL